MAGRRKARAAVEGASLFMVEVRAGDFEGLCRFYGEVLGLPSAMRDEPNAFAMFGKAPPYVAVVGKPLKGARGRSRVVPDFAVDDLDAALKGLRAKGVRVLSPPAASHEGYRIARVADPEGNEVHLFEWTKPRA